MSIETGGLETLALQRSAMSENCPNYSIILKSTIDIQSKTDEIFLAFFFKMLHTL